VTSVGRGEYRCQQSISTRNAPTASDVVISVRTGTGIVRADEDDRLEALLVTAPPPTDAEHATGREGIQRAEFDPIDSMTD